MDSLASPALLTAADVSGLLRVPVSTVWSLARRGLLPSVCLGRLYRFRPADVDAWVAAGGARTAPERLAGAVAERLQQGTP